MLKCPVCTGNFILRVGYTGTDWESAAGEGSGYGYEAYLACQKCGIQYTIGYLRDPYEFAPPKSMPYLRAEGFMKRSP